MSRHLKKIAVLVNFLPDYREDLYRRLLSRDDLDVTIFCHTPPTGAAFKSIHELFSPRVVVLPVYFFRGETLVWSVLPWWRLLTQFDVVVVEGNPRYVAHALLATLLRIMGKSVVLWTMVQSFRNDPRRQRIRLAWTRIFRKVLVYNESEAEMLLQQGFMGDRVFSINNGLNQDKILSASAAWTRDGLARWRASNGLNGRKIILSCGRLQPKNKFEQVLEALEALMPLHPDILWCLVGDGPERERLLSEVQRRNLQEHARFLGAIYGEDDLAPWFLSAELLVNPGAIGLSILHSFGYGLPVVTHGDKLRHGPEFVAFREGITGHSFPEDDVASMSDVMESVLANPDARAEMSEQCMSIAKDKYNTRIMADRFVQCIGAQ